MTQENKKREDEVGDEYSVRETLRTIHRKQVRHDTTHQYQNAQIRSLRKEIETTSNQVREVKKWVYTTLTTIILSMISTQLGLL